MYINKKYIYAHDIGITQTRLSLGGQEDKAYRLMQKRCPLSDCGDGFLLLCFAVHVTKVIYLYNQRSAIIDKTLGLSAGRSGVRIPGRGKCSLRTISVEARVNYPLYLYTYVYLKRYNTNLMRQIVSGCILLITKQQMQKYLFNFDLTKRFLNIYQHYRQVWACTRYSRVILRSFFFGSGVGN